MKDFFISYTNSDNNYATWVAEVLEKHGYSVTIQEWDFTPGDNFVAKINEALIECDKLIIILSRRYLESKWCEAEWTSKLAEQQNNKDRRIIPIRVEPVDLKGLLLPIVHIDITDKSAVDAERLILDGISGNFHRISRGYPGYFNVEHSEIDVDYSVSDNTITYIKTCKSKVLTGGKNCLHNRITWFADETVDVVSLTNGVSVEYLDLHDTNVNYNVVFDHLLQKDEEIEFQIKAILSNKNKHFKNFFSTEVITPIKSLNIHLSLPNSEAAKIYTQKLSSSPMNVRSESPKEHMFRCPFHWHISNPELNFEYKIYW